jgi:hypothetical protein
MSLQDILDIERQRIKRERVVLTTVYDRMKNRINNSVRVKSKECVYTIPGIIPGYPLVDIPKTMEYLLHKLITEGFIAFQLNDTDLYITWDPYKIRQLDEIKKNHEKKEKVVETKNKPIMDKEFERSNDDFLNYMIMARKDSKN